MGNARGRAASRRLTSRQSRAVEPPQAAIPELVAPPSASPTSWHRRSPRADARYQHADEKPHRIQAHLSSIGSPSLPTLAQFGRGTIASGASAVKRNNDSIISSGKRSK
jgi:hypothetical protein